MAPVLARESSSWSSIRGLEVPRLGAGADAHGDGVFDAGARGAPGAKRREGDLRRGESRVLPCSVLRVPPAQTTPPPFFADAKGHQRAAALEVDAAPVPAGGFGGEVLARPFVVEPGAAGDLFCCPCRARSFRSPRAADGCSSSSPRPGAGPCGCSRRRPRASASACAVRARSSANSRAGTVAAIGIAVEREAPVVDPGVGGVLGRASEAERFAPGALVVAQPAERRIGERGVREHDLARGEFARVVGRRTEGASGRTSPGSRAARRPRRASRWRTTTRCDRRDVRRGRGENEAE